jgi:hypothetical protein
MTWGNSIKALFWIVSIGAIGLCQACGEICSANGT